MGEASAHSSDNLGEAAQGQVALDVNNEMAVRDMRAALRIKHNQVFAMLTSTGEVPASQPGFGVFFHDMCFINQWDIRLGGEPLIALAAEFSLGSEARFELTNGPTANQGHTSFAQGKLRIRRTMRLQDTLEDEIILQSMNDRPLDVDLAFTFESSFEDLYVIRGSKVGKRGRLHEPRWTGPEVELRYDGADGRTRRTRVRFDRPPSSTERGRATFSLHFEARGKARISSVMNVSDEALHEEESDDPQPGRTATTDTHRRFGTVLAQSTTFCTSNELFNRVLKRSLDDVRMLASANDGDSFVAAGVPWYMALFGRDSLICAFQLLAFQPALAKMTLELLARHQGRARDDFRDEEPGKILHELRQGEMANLKEVPMTPYYGTVDATPWFLILAGSYFQWTGDADLVARLMPNIEAALGWIEGNIAESGRGFLTYGSRSKRGLTNQGWKDSGNSIVHRDGSIARAPISLVEVQGYVYRAWQEIAPALRAFGSVARAEALEERAANLKKAFQKSFYDESMNYYALAIADDGRVESVTSNPGQLLFTGLLSDGERLSEVARRLFEDDMYSGWGVRTLSSSEKSYNPIDYQVGAVWPHDNSLIALGLQRCGFCAAFEKVFTGIFDAATLLPELRLPEVLDGFARRDYPQPVPYPVACFPQAWAAGAVPLMVCAALGLEPSAPANRLTIRKPHLPPWLEWIEVKGLRVGAGTADLRYDRSGDLTRCAVIASEGLVTVFVDE